MKNLIIHIGDKKTGSSSIQKVLLELSRDKNATFDYPLTSLGSLFQNHNALARRLSGEPLLVEHGSTGLARDYDPRDKAMAREICSSEAGIVILSAELFEHLEPLALLNFLDDFGILREFEVKVMAYVRPHSARIISNFTQEIKKGYWLQSLEKYFEYHRDVTKQFNYYPRLSRWKHVFHDRFHLRPHVDVELRQGSVIADFFDFAGLLNVLPRCCIETRLNQRLTLEELSMLREFHKNNSDIPVDDRAQIGLAIASRVVARKNRTLGTKPGIHRSLAKEITEAYSEDAKRVDDAFVEGKSVLQEQLKQSEHSSLPTKQTIDADRLLQCNELSWISCFSELLGDLYKHSSEAELMPVIKKFVAQNQY